MIARKLESPRLVCHSSGEVPAESVLEYCIRNKDFLKDTEPEREESFYTLGEQERLLSKDASCDNGYRFWLRKKEDPLRVIGTVGLNNIVMGAFRSCFLGYRLDREELNRGYMTEALARCIDFAFQEIGLHRLEANIMPRNAPSLRVVQKLGFRNEGLSEKYLRINGIWEDHIHMVLLNPNEPV